MTLKIIATAFFDPVLDHDVLMPMYRNVDIDLIELLGLFSQIVWKDLFSICLVAAIIFTYLI